MIFMAIKPLCNFYGSYPFFQLSYDLFRIIFFNYWELAQVNNIEIFEKMESLKF